MKIFKQSIAILTVSFIIGLIFNAYSPRGIGVFDNPWSKNAVNATVHQLKQNHQREHEEPISIADFDRAYRFIDNKEGIILDARNPREYVEGHIPGAYLLYCYNMNEYYPKLEERLRESPALLLYCSDINCDDSDFLANELFSMGYEPILLYKGGFEDWKAHQLPVSKGREKDPS